MIGAVLLLQLTLWVASTQAFFPWMPCEDGKSCVTFDLHQRTPDHDEDIPQRHARAARVATRLAQKHAPLEAWRAFVHPRLVGRANKYSVIPPLPPTASKSAGVFQDASDYSYFVQVKFGAAEKPLYMLVDSGAGTTWVMGSTCKSTACGMHDSFGPDDSKTLKADTKTFSISYGSGKVSGQLARDTVSVAGMKIDMTFGLANDTSDDFTHFPFDGILGLSMSRGSTDNLMTILADSKAFDARIFSVNLGRGADGINNGQITFGGVDPAKYTGDITYTAVAAKANGDWAIPLDSFGYEGKSPGITGRLAYIDTGTSFVFGPESDVAAIHKVIQGATSEDNITYTVPCDIDKPLTISFSGVTYELSAKDWITKRDGVCVSNIYGHEVVKGAWLFGDLFLKNVYAVFDGEQKRIGFAKKAALPDVPKTTIINSPAEPTGAAPSTRPIAPGGPGTSSPSGQAEGSSAAETGAEPKATPAQASLANQVENSIYVSVLCLLAAVAMVA
ncbi:hypothetical protein OQA88_1989 [Cercophora sp. LCS_1]